MWRPTGELNLADLPHTHHAGEDAAELAQVFAAILAHRDRLGGS